MGLSENAIKETSVRHRIGNLQMNIYTYGGHVPYHWHDEYEIIRITSGECECIIDGKHIFLEKDSAIVINGHERHTVSPVGNRHNLNFYAVVVHPYVIFGTDCNQFYNPKMNFRRLLKDKNTLAILDKIADTYKEKRYGYEMIMKACIIDIFSKLYFNREFSICERTYSEETNTFSDIITYIHTNYCEKIRLEDLQGLAYCSKSYIIQMFRRNTGKTPIEYINSYRLYMSTELLRNNNYTILDISMKCGFENVGYFIKLFKKEFGITPLKYRKQSESSDTGNISEAF